RKNQAASDLLNFHELFFLDNWQANVRFDIKPSEHSKIANGGCDSFRFKRWMASLLPLHYRFKNFFFRRRKVSLLLKRVRGKDHGRNNLRLIGVQPKEKVGRFLNDRFPL